MDKSILKQVKAFTWEIPQSFRKDMKVPARIYASEKMLEDILKDESLKQLVNVATLPGIVERAIVMPDVHQGYGMPIGGVAAFDLENEGIISAGMTGFDINCGVRILTSSFKAVELKEKLPDLTSQIQRDVPSGVGRGGPLRLNSSQLDMVLNQGSCFIVAQGYGTEEDLESTEEKGSFSAARASAVSPYAKKRGADQLGTLGAGNHFLELQEVVAIFDEKAAETFGLFKGQLTVMIHCGSRGLGHQVCTDYSRRTLNELIKKGIRLPDRELAYAPFESQLGQDYFGAMAASANFAWANRQVIAWRIRKSFDKILGEGSSQKLLTLYDVAHNIAKVEKHALPEISNQQSAIRDKVKLIVHRKGATRSFGPDRQEVPEKYRKIGQPVLIPGSMGTSSWVLVGTKQAEKEAFGSSCHGAGRRMSRHKAMGVMRGEELKQKLEAQGVIVRAGCLRGLSEEGSYAYKDVDEVVEVVHQVGLAKKVAQLKPLAVIKG